MMMEAEADEVVTTLRKWGLAQEIIDKFEANKIKMDHFPKFTERMLEALIPAAGDRLDFMDKLSSYKKEQRQHDILVLDLNVTDASSDPPHGARIITSHEESNDRVSILETIFQEPNNTIKNEDDVNNNHIHKMDKNTCDGAPPKKFKTENDYNLKSILSSTPKGQGVLAFYNVKKCLNDLVRNNLADAIISNELSKDINASLPDERIQSLTKSIIDLFPKEHQTVWAGPKGSKRAIAVGRGKLLNRYYNMRRNLARNGIVFRNHSIEGNPVDENLPPPDEEDSDQNVWLKNNRAPWGKVVEYWVTTSNERVRKLHSSAMPIHQYMDEYPGLRTPDGYLLLQMDFDEMYPAAQMKLYSEWPDLAAFIASKLSSKDRQAIEESLTPDGKKIRTLHSLNKLFNVVTAVRQSKSSKVTWRPSRQECRDGFLLMVKSSAEIKPTLALREEKYKKYGLTLNINPVIVGDEDYITESYVSVNNIDYMVESPFKVSKRMLQGMAIPPASCIWNPNYF